MALEFAHGAVQWLSSDAATTTYVVSGLGFQPKALRFYYVGIQSSTDSTSVATHGQVGVGFATSSSDRRCVSAYNQDGPTTTVCGAAYRTDAIAVVQDGTTTPTGLLDISSFDSGGFTLVVDDQTPQSITLFYEAWGGSDILNAATGEISEPASTGNVDYSVTGSFQPDVVMFAGGHCTGSANTTENTDFGICAGAASSGSTSNNYVHATWSVDASANTQTYRYGQGGECLAMGTIGGGNPDARATMTQFNSDGFRLNWIARGTTGRKSIYLAIRGARWTAGEFLIAAGVGSTAAISNGSYAPKGVSMCMIRNTEPTAGVAHTSASGWWLGTGTSTTSRRSMGYLEVNNQAAAATNIGVEYDQVVGDYLNPGRHLDIQSVDSFGYTIVRESMAEAAADYWQGYLMWGDAPPGRIPRGVSVGHPFII